MAADPGKYLKAMPIVAAHPAKIERAVDRTRASHAGQPYAAIHQALVEVLQDENAQRVVPQVIEELTRQISVPRPTPFLTSTPDINDDRQQESRATPWQPQTPSVCNP
ncbi:hypothetical protein GCM10018966_073000 [Streptomyces yanii]